MYIYYFVNTTVLFFVSNKETLISLTFNFNFIPETLPLTPSSINKKFTTNRLPVSFNEIKHTENLKKQQKH